MENAAVLEILDFVEGFDPALHRNTCGRSIRARDVEADHLARLDLGESLDRDTVTACDTERVPGSALCEGKWRNAHADEIRTVNAFERLRDDSANAEQVGTLCRPGARRAVAVFDAGEHDKRHALFFIKHRRIVYRHLL